MTSVDLRPTDAGEADLERALLAPPPRRSAWKSFLVEVVGPFIVFWIVIGVWYFISYRLLKPHRRFLMPPPHRVLDVAFLDGRNRSELLNGLWNSTKVAMVGLAIAIVLGMLFAIIMSQAKWIERSLFPYAVVLQTIPILALVPLIGFWFDFNFRSRVIVCVLIAIFPIINNTLFGLLSADQGQHDLFTLHEASRFTRLWRLQLPAGMPAIFAGFRIAVPYAIGGAVIAELISSNRGLGYLVQTGAMNFDTTQVFVAILAATLIVHAFIAVIDIGERFLLRWRPRGANLIVDHGT